MAWPNASKASTSNCDEGSDSISSARADIKQNIDNVNEIIDEFPSGPYGSKGEYSTMQYFDMSTLNQTSDSAGVVEWALLTQQVAEITLTAPDVEFLPKRVPCGPLSTSILSISNKLISEPLISSI